MLAGSVVDELVDVESPGFGSSEINATIEAFVEIFHKIKNTTKSKVINLLKRNFIYKCIIFIKKKLKYFDFNIIFV